MVIGTLELDLRIPGADSLKAKRMALRSLKDRLRQQFNVSVAEIADNDLWQNATLAVVMVSNDRRHCNESLSKIAAFVEDEREVVLDDYRLGLF